MLGARRCISIAVAAALLAPAGADAQETRKAVIEPGLGADMNAGSLMPFTDPDIYYDAVTLGANDVTVRVSADGRTIEFRDPGVQIASAAAACTGGWGYATCTRGQPYTVIGGRLGRGADRWQMHTANLDVIDVVAGGGENDVIAGHQVDGGGGADDLTLVSRARRTPLGRGGDGDDTLRPSPGGWALLFGGDGNDLLLGAGELRGEAGDDVLRSGDGWDVLRGGPGADLLEGGGGHDDLDGGDGADVMSGGEGVDVVSYTEGTYRSISASLDGVANDGAAGENDFIHADVEDLEAGARTSDPDPLTDQEGGATLIGDDGPNRLEVDWAGSNRPAIVAGHGGNDTMVLLVDSTADGGAGDDAIWAGEFMDFRTGVPDMAIDVAGGDGNDFIYVWDGASSEGLDRVACGPGVDVVHGDPGDTIAADCETVSLDP